MQNNYAYENELLFIYNELDEDEADIFQLTLRQDPELNEEYHSLVKILQHLDHVFIEPSRSTIDLIAEHSATMARTRAHI